MTDHDRRKYRRIRAPLYCRPAGMELFARKRQPIDLSLGGVRIYTDDRLKVGQLLKLEFFAQDAPPVTYTAEVVWIVPLDVAAAARFDVGLKFLHLEPDALKMLVSVLGPLEDDPRGEEPSDQAQDDHGQDDQGKEKKKDAQG
ncbi:MAG: PilZ domain-containing protein [Myxococcota bacterium]|nr:PilZ domain-containing protein [Myxococcota bacterium]